MSNSRYLENKPEFLEFTKISQLISENSFAKIWDNDEDSIYDNL